MTEPVRVAVVGFGLAGKIFHADVIRFVPGLELYSIVQRKGDEATQAFPGVKIYRSIEQMLGDTSIRLVVIATPSYSHFELAEQCLRDQRHVVIDKPFTLTSAEAATLIQLARERKLLLSAYQNRRWDGDFKTVQQIIQANQLGRLVTYESHFDRFRPEPNLGVWRESGGPGSGTLFDLGPHLIDQALTLFGTPVAINADVRRDRSTANADDAFDIRLDYQASQRFTVWLRASSTARIAGPRFLLHGTGGSFLKWGLDPQEDAMKAGQSYATPGFGEDAPELWGELRVADGTTTRIRTLAGDYRGYYANVRDALLGVAPLAVTAEQAWRTTRLIELARASSGRGQTLPVDFSNRP